jgi:thioredoxin-related protein
MIDQETYAKSLAKLEEKEKANKIAFENGQAFMKLYGETIQKAKNEKRQIFLLFTLSGCDGCNVLKYTIENDKQVQNYMNKYLFLNCDISNTRTNLTEKYNLYSYPACFIIDSNENIVKQRIGCPITGGASRNLIHWMISK